MNRRLTRSEIVKILFGMEFDREYDTNYIDEYMNHFADENSEDLVFDERKLDVDLVKKTINDVITNKEEIDGLINEYSKDWKLNRIAKVDMTIMRVAIAEMLYNNDIPVSVSINEAVNTCKEYSEENSSKFINGVLGSISRRNG